MTVDEIALKIIVAYCTNVGMEKSILEKRCIVQEAYEMAELIKEYQQTDKNR